MLTRTKQAHGKASRDPSTRECTGQSTERFGRDAQARLPGRRGLGVLHTAFLYRLVCDTKLRALLSIITYVFSFNFLPTPPCSAFSLGLAFSNQLSKCTMVLILGFMSIESCTYTRALWTIMLETKNIVPCDSQNLGLTRRKEYRHGFLRGKPESVPGSQPSRN